MTPIPPPQRRQVPSLRAKIVEQQSRHSGDEMMLVTSSVMLVVSPHCHAACMPSQQSMTNAFIQDSTTNFTALTAPLQ